MSLRKVYLLATVVLGLILFLDAITSLILADRPPSGLLGLLLMIHMGFSIGAIADFRRRGERAWLAWTWLLCGAGYLVGGLSMAEAAPAAIPTLRHLPTMALIAQIGFGVGLIPLTIVYHASGREAPVEPPQPEGAARPRCRLGVASFVLSLCGPLVFVGGSMLAYFVASAELRGPMAPGTGPGGMAFFLVGVLAFMIEHLACGLGVASLFSRGKRQGLGVAGLCISGAISVLILFGVAMAALSTRFPPAEDPNLPAPQAAMVEELTKGLLP